jgi:hypothetical protein
MARREVIPGESFINLSAAAPLIYAPESKKGAQPCRRVPTGGPAACSGPKTKASRRLPAGRIAHNLLDFY